MTPSNTSYVILGMLRIGQRTGYEIKQFVDKSTRFFWAASYGQIYPELKKLEDAGLVRGEADPQGGRQRRSYELTAAGEELLDAWLRDSGDLGIELRDLGLLKLFFADALDADAAVALARAARERHEATLAALEEVERSLGRDAGHDMRLEVLHFGLDLQRWCVQRFAQLERDLIERAATEQEEAA